MKNIIFASIVLMAISYAISDSYDKRSSWCRKVLHQSFPDYKETMKPRYFDFSGLGVPDEKNKAALQVFEREFTEDELLEKYLEGRREAKAQCEYNNKIIKEQSVVFIISFTSFIFSSLYIAFSKRKEILGFITRTRVQRAGLVVFAIGVIVYPFEAHELYYDELPVVTCSILVVAVGMISTLFTRIITWVKGSS